MSKGDKLLPLQCVKCKERFEISIESKQDALELQSVLSLHSASHKDTLPDYDLVDQHGVLCSKSNELTVRQEEKMLSKFSSYQQ